MARKTVASILKLAAKRKLVMITAYDAVSARLVDEASDIALVGDSVGTTVQGGSNTVSVTMDEMIYHTRIVVRNTNQALVVGDMPFMSYQASRAEALRNAGRFLKEAGCQAVKVEGGSEETAATVSAMVEAGIPVMGHLGFTPQSELLTGAKVVRDGDRLEAELQRLVKAGCFAIVLELVQSDIAQRLQSLSPVPTIGIGSGPHCGGQVLVFHDLLGCNPNFQPRFVKKYMDFAGQAAAALAAFQADVQSGMFPGPEHSHDPEPKK